MNPSKFYALEEAGGTWAVFTPDGMYVIGELTKADADGAVAVINDWLDRQ